MQVNVPKGILAGFIATIALSVLMVLKAAMGMMPQMNAIKMLTGMAHGMMGMPASPVVGWIIHFIIGSIIWGILFAVLIERIPGQSSTAKGLVFGTAAWVLMMVIVMPMAGAGLFGLKLGIGAPIATLILHWVYGAVLGVVYGGLVAPARAVQQQ